MIRLRKAVALAALITFGALIVTSNPAPHPQGGVLSRATWPLLLPLAATIVGLLREAPWSRWLALAAAIAVLPWAVALALTPDYLVPIARPATALAAALALLASLPGKAMFERYEGRSRGLDWSGRRMTLVRWTVICNSASVLALYLFVAAFDFQIEWYALILAVTLCGLILGVLLLAYQRTVGLLVVALCCLCFPPAGLYFVWQEAIDVGEAILFLVIFAPGLLTGWASLLVFARPMWRYLRSG
ncbi:MAG: hypothetical protein JSU87_13650 [Gemmatimonadota bacterium]|nr:MAG: hypothetical protein JSU87_13650 [Gemmatimonadota bacterium]